MRHQLIKQAEYFRKKLSDIMNNAQYLSTTIDDFRDFFKPNKSKKEVSFNELIEDVLNIIKIALTNKNIKLIQELNCEERFSTYSNEIKQVILNLIKNSEDVLIEKKISDPYIKISTYKKENKYILEISDNGGGIPEKIMDKVFDPYFSTKSKKDGTGLGLYMSKTIVEEHCRGKLRVSNSSDGAIFKIELMG